MLSRRNVSKFFLEDVTNYFLDNEIPISEHRNILGKSGSFIPFETEIGHIRKRNSSMFKVVNRLSGSEFSNPSRPLKNLTKHLKFIIVRFNLDHNVKVEFVSLHDCIL